MSAPAPQEYTHDRLGENFADLLSMYDTRRRVETLIDEFLAGEPLAGRRVLDVGCGLGYFSERLHRLGADVTAVDIGPHLVELTRKRVGCACEVADALGLEAHFGRDSFDVVVSSECIEHTRAPDEALRQMIAVLKPGGLLAVSTPNILWYPVVRLATLVRVRPFMGFEHFSSWRGIERVIVNAGAGIVRRKGLHLLPFQLPCRRFLTWCDGRLQLFRGLMINICILARKRPAGA
jgi:2-polyprenyl-6-hydroxyphenyl methylase/3-demethylubiquinone-9 3-methyltransferase